MTETLKNNERPPVPHIGVPLSIGHRGFRGLFPENTILGFDEAVKAGTDVLELDIHESSDDVIVISHDKTTDRCFGKPGYSLPKVPFDGVLNKLSTIQEPHVKLPSLSEILDKLINDENYNNVKIMIDIKFTNRIEVLENLLNLLIKHNEDLSFWKDKIIIGLWNIEFFMKFLEISKFNGFKIIHISFSIFYTKKLIRYLAKNKPDFKMNGVSMIHMALFGSNGGKFIKEIRNQDLELYSWTVNDEEIMKWMIKSQMFKGIVSDRPDQVIKVLNSSNINVANVESNSEKEFEILNFTSLGQRFQFFFYKTIDSIFWVINNLCGVF